LDWVPWASWGHGAPPADCKGLVTQSTPKLIEALKGVKVRAVEAGAAHCLVVSSDGEVYSFGHGARGRLGHGVEQSQQTPKVIEALAGVKVRSVAAGYYCTTAWC
jgi:alpha-tubulin suppressor-like RCC1 family protein